MRRYLGWVLPLLSLPVLLLLGYGLTRDTFILPSPLVGNEAPPFRLETFDGDTLGLTDLRGRVVVINFWASWCGPCRVEHPALLNIESLYARDEVALIGIANRDRRVDSERFLAALGGNWTQLIETNNTALDYGVYGLPETFFIDREGRVARKRVGAVVWETARATIDSLLAGPVAEVGDEGSSVPAVDEQGS
ncbi:MAG: redoxin family protein [Gemmatimonadota bacterium]